MLLRAISRNHVELKPGERVVRCRVGGGGGGGGVVNNHHCPVPIAL